MNVPIGLAVLALAPRLVPRDAPSGHRRLDLRGLSVAVPAVFLVELPLMLGHQEGWPRWTFVCMAFGCALAVVFIVTERAVAAAGGDPLLRLSVLRSPGLLPGLGAIALLMTPYGGFLFSFAIHLQTRLGYDALRGVLVFAPCAVAFALCGYFWRRLPARWHPFLTPAGCLAGAAGYSGAALTLHSGESGGLLLQACLVVTGSGLALAFSPLITHALVGVPMTSAADASGLLTTAIQLGQAVGVAAFDSLFLTLDEHRASGGHIPGTSGHAIAVTQCWIGLATTGAALAAIPLTRTALAARRALHSTPGLSAMRKAQADPRMNHKPNGCRCLASGRPPGPGTFDSHRGLNRQAAYSGVGQPVPAGPSASWILMETVTRPGRGRVAAGSRPRRRPAGAGPSISITELTSIFIDAAAGSGALKRRSLACAIVAIYRGSYYRLWLEELWLRVTT